MVIPRPPIPEADEVQGSETVIARQGGVLRRFSFPMLRDYFFGAKGDKGDTGPRGAVGPAGPKGDQGAPGSAGPTGPKGDQGATGAPGERGPTGLEGARGLQGLTGAKGDKGDIGPGSIVNLGTVTIAETGFTVAVAAGVRSVAVSAQGVVAGETLIVVPTQSMPKGYSLGAPVAKAKDTLEVSVTTPAITIGGGYSFGVRIYAVRP